MRDRVVLMRVDHNVPLDAAGAMVHDRRIRLTVPGIAAVARQARMLILLSHLGYPRGRIVPVLTTRPLAQRLSKLTAMPVRHVPCSDPNELGQSVSSYRDRILYAENVRFLPGEELNESLLARGWAGLADIYINDAFSVSHRAHASVAGIPQYVSSLAGPTLATECDAISAAINAPRPRMLICGGAKYVDKLRSTAQIAREVEIVAFGGLTSIVVALATGALPAAAANGLNFTAACDDIERLGNSGARILVPEDWIVASADALPRVLAGHEVKDVTRIVDVGPRWMGHIEATLAQCSSVLWSGPLGRYEIPAGRAATCMLIEALARFVARGGHCAYGGGDTVAAKFLCLPYAKCGFASSGGGAFLAFVAARGGLPGLVPLGRHALGVDSLMSSKRVSHE
jgi:phosphoglycerate kinase